MEQLCLRSDTLYIAQSYSLRRVWTCLHSSEWTARLLSSWLCIREKIENSIFCTFALWALVECIYYFAFAVVLVYIFG